jgi:cytochrome c oxidase subunit 1
MFGYTAIVLAIIGQGFLSFGLWIHHMYATGLPRLGNSFFAASSMAIAIPSGIVLFCWIATIATGRVRVGLPMLWIISFFFLFVIGGLSGVMLASVPIDLQVTDTYVLPSHIHFVLLGGAVCPMIAAAWFWFPKLTGRSLGARLGVLQWALFLVGALVSFGAMFLLGLSGMTRRVYTYPHSMEWDVLNLVASLGGWAIGLSFLVMLVNICIAYAKSASAPDNPFDAPTLEWATSSPPSVYNFARLPIVDSRSPLWTHRGPLATVSGLRVDEREILVTSAVETVPEMREHAPSPTIWPLAAALVTTVILVASIYTPQAIPWGAIPLAVVMIGWLYPKRILAPRPVALPKGADR